MTAVMLSVENGSSVSSWVGSLSVSWCICLNDQATKLEIHFYKRCVSELRSFSLYSFFRTNDSPLTSRTIMIRTSPTVCEGAGGIEKEFFIRKYVLHQTSELQKNMNPIKRFTHFLCFPYCSEFIFPPAGGYELSCHNSNKFECF